MHLRLFSFQKYDILMTRHCKSYILGFPGDLPMVFRNQNVKNSQRNKVLN